jgi:hypothetical protein
MFDLRDKQHLLGFLPIEDIKLSCEDKFITNRIGSISTHAEVY